MLLLIAAILGGLGLALLAFRREVDTSGAFDDTWTLKTPARLVISGLAVGAAMTSAALWLAFGDKESVAGDVPLAHTSGTPWLVFGIAGTAFFGGATLLGFIIIAFSPHHSLLAMRIDDEHVVVQHGLRKPKKVAWSDVVDLEISGPERSDLGSELTIVYRTGNSRTLSRIHLSKFGTGLAPEELDDILSVRWQPDLEPNPRPGND